MNKKTLIVVLGPTAVGKTSLAIELAEYFKTEILSCDSRQFYKELNIGVARPSLVELQKVKHHFIGHISVNQYYNVSKFEQEALVCLEGLFRERDVAVMVGGSGMYIDALCDGIAELPDADIELRKELEDKLQKEGLDSLRSMLKMLDPEYYALVDLANPVRITRALEVILATGKTYSSFRTQSKAERPFHIVKIGLEQDRNVLYERINQRVDIMFQEGLLEEVSSLLSYKDKTALKTVGYTELFRFFDGHYSLDEAVEKIKTNTRRYAKRQMTWFKRYDDIHWYSPSDLEEIIRFIEAKI